MKKGFAKKKRKKRIRESLCTQIQKDRAGLNKINLIDNMNKQTEIITMIGIEAEAVEVDIAEEEDEDGITVEEETTITEEEEITIAVEEETTIEIHTQAEMHLASLAIAVTK